MRSRKNAATPSIRNSLTENTLSAFNSIWTELPLIIIFKESTIKKIDPTMVGMKNGFPFPYFLNTCENNAPKMYDIITIPNNGSEYSSNDIINIVETF